MYKKVIIIAVLVFLFSILMQWRAATQIQPPSVLHTTSTSIARPRLLQISRVGIYAPIESVGLDSQGRMGVPSTWDTVGWYNKGFIPGEAGSAVIVGHLDRSDGKPAIFWNLNRVHMGDEITITDENDNIHTFIVDRIVSYKANETPLEEIFNTTGKKRLNLITCEGTYSVQNGGYSNRLVVYSIEK